MGWCESETGGGKLVGMKGKMKGKEYERELNERVVQHIVQNHKRKQFTATHQIH
jgi:hypothetical protein